MNTAAYLNFGGSVEVSGDFNLSDSFVSLSEGGGPLMAPVPIVSSLSFTEASLPVELKKSLSGEFFVPMYSISAEAISISGIDFVLQIGSDFAEEVKNHSWELLSSNTPIAYGSDSTLRVDDPLGRFISDNFELLTEEYSVSIQYSSVPEPDFIGALFAVVVLLTKFLPRRGHGYVRT